MSVDLDHVHRLIVQRVSGLSDYCVGDGHIDQAEGQLSSWLLRTMGNLSSREHRVPEGNVYHCTPNFQFCKVPSWFLGNSE